MTDENIKALSQDYNERIIKILDDIDTIKKEMIVDISSCMKYGERLHALFILLTKKITNKEELKKQIEFNEQQQRNFILVTKNTDEEGVSCRPYQSISYQKVPKYIKVLEEREIHLLSLIEGMEKKKGRVN